MSEHFEQLRKEKELIKMRESLMSDWRRDLMEEEEHPYVDVMPSADQKEKDAAKKKKEKKEEENPEREEVKEDYEGYDYAGKEGKHHKVSNGIQTKYLTNKEFGEFSRQKLGRKKKEVKEGFFSSVNKKKQAAARERLAKHKAAMEGGGKSPYCGKLKDGKDDKGTGKDPWSTHPDDAKAFAKDMEYLGKKDAESVKEEVEQITENRYARAQQEMDSYIDRRNTKLTNDARAITGKSPVKRDSTRQQMRDNRTARRGHGGGWRKDDWYDPNTGSSLTTDKSGKSDMRVFARKGGKPGYLNKETGNWQAADASHRGVQQAARRHDQLSKPFPGDKTSPSTETKAASDRRRGGATPTPTPTAAGNTGTTASRGKTTPTTPSSSSSTTPRPTSTSSSSSTPRPTSTSVTKPSGTSKSDINKEYDRLRKSGDTKGAEAYGRKMHAKTFNKPAPTSSTSSSVSSPAKTATSNVNSTMKSAGSSVSAPKASGISSQRLSDALGSVGKYTPSKKAIKEGIEMFEDYFGYESLVAELVETIENTDNNGVADLARKKLAAVVNNIVSRKAQKKKAEEEEMKKKEANNVDAYAQSLNKKDEEEQIEEHYIREEANVSRHLSLIETFSQMNLKGNSGWSNSGWS